MKNLIILFCLLTLVSCGKDGRNITIIKEVPGPRVDVPGPTKEVEKPNLAEGFVGNWFETNVEGGETFIGISLTPDGQIEIETTGQMISSVNPSNDSLANHPILSYTNVILQDEKVRLLNKRYNYSSTTHYLRSDTGSSITGNRRTDIIMEKTSDDILKVTIRIYAKDINLGNNKVVATRVFNLK